MIGSQFPTRQGTVAAVIGTQQQLVTQIQQGDRRGAVHAFDDVLHQNGARRRAVGLPQLVAIGIGIGAEIDVSPTVRKV